jgi:hypothetical protein
MKRKMLEANQIAEFSRKDDNSPVELKPNIFGLGLDLKKVYRRVRGLFNKKK